jgi:hypothetical protein
LLYITAIKGSIPVWEEVGSKGADGESLECQGHKTPVNAQRYDINIESQDIC